ncbi:glycosyltransferase family 2 protein [Castellaniella sp.]|uniref:glycosyltransferase family 2 protein n=1 Tax=Castellaniella sp. TaxID=1955812 RepID=UPI002AFE9903|nr:glycosyltransferase family 2 protein [Castellaniella sp.]
MRPVVSIVMPAYKAAQTLDQSVRSIVTQSCEDWELLLVVDGSPDNTLDLAHAWARQDSRIRIFHHPNNLGVAAARNHALDKAEGQYITFLDADDWWMTDKLSIQLDFMKTSKALLSYTAYQRWGAHGLINTVVPPAAVTYDRMLRGSVIAIMTGMLHRDVVNDVRFREIGHEDFLFWLQALRRVSCGHRIPVAEPMAVYRIQEASRSANLMRNAGWQWHIYRHELSLSWPRSCGLMGGYVRQALAKRLRKHEHQKN